MSHFQRSCKRLRMPRVRGTVVAVFLQGMFLFCVHGLNAQTELMAPINFVGPKNIINIMLDDADYSDFGFNNYTIEQPDAITPNMDRLRAGGRLFPNFFAAASICSPTRVSVLTGCNPVRFGALNAWPAIPRIRQGNLGNAGLPYDVPQLGTIMQALGKKTGHFGKWHVGSARPDYLPTALGFDEYGEYVPPAPPGFWSGRFNLYSSAWGAYAKDLDNVDEEFTNMVGDFIRRKAAEPNGFFVNFWPYSPHAPWAVPTNFDNSRTNFDLSTNRGKLLAMMYSIDVQIGRIVALVDSLGIREQTLIVLTSDNGGHHFARNRSPRLFGTKGTLSQGGVKVSMVANWRGTIEANSTNHSVIASYDLMPTFFDLCAGGAPVALYPNIDGRSRLDAFFDVRAKLHDPLYSEVQSENFRTSDERAQKTYSVLVGSKRLTKIIGLNPSDPNAYVLNDLQSDPSGTVDVARSKPLVVREMKKQLAEARLATSRVPFPNIADAQPKTLFFDPRLDICKRESTFIVTVDQLVPLTRAANILASPGSFAIEILRDGSVHWTIQGTDSSGSIRQQKLSTQPVNKGVQLMFTAQGYKDAASLMHNQIYVNGRIAADSDRLPVREQITSFSSTASDLILGDRRLLLKKIKFHTLRFWPDEID